MKKYLLVAIMSIVLFVGCTEEQQQKVDRAAVKAQAVVSAVQPVLSSPAGELVPQPYRTYAEISLGILAGLAGMWQQFRNSKLKTVAKAIVTAIELAGSAGDVVKPLVAQQLDQVKLYEQGKSIISALKPTMTAATAEQKQAA